MDVRDKVVVVTGGAWGIGQAVARAYADAGAKVAIIDYQQEAGERFAQEMCSTGADMIFYHGDLSVQADLEKFVEYVISVYAGIDLLVNNGMSDYRGIQSGCSYEEFTRTLQIGVTAPYYLTQLFLPYFREHAAIINLSSTRAFQSQADTESYTAAKGGVTALTHALAVSLAGRVRVNAIAPGWIDTGDTYDRDYVPDDSNEDLNQHPSKRVGHPDDIVRATMFLSDERNSFINGQTLIVDGGMSKRMIYTGDEGWLYTGE